MHPQVSICIPAYRQTFLLKQNLESIAAQSYKHFEVLVSDDSPDDAVFELVKTFQPLLPLQYFRNKPSLGSPFNWNLVLSKAKGKYVLLLHHDDKFADENSLNLFLRPFEDADTSFVFGRNEAIHSFSKGRSFSPSYFKLYYKIPYLIITQNLIGAPSNVMFRNKVLMRYDERYKWAVDMEYYTRIFEAGLKFSYIDKTLIITGRHEGQITNECLSDKQVLIYENVLYAIDHIKLKINSIQVFDFYWRLLRNTGVKNLIDITQTGINQNQVPSFIKNIISVQRRLPRKILTTGLSSKLAMVTTYIFAR